MPGALVSKNWHVAPLKMHHAHHQNVHDTKESEKNGSRSTAQLVDLLIFWVNWIYTANQQEQMIRGNIYLYFQGSLQYDTEDND